MQINENLDLEKKDVELATAVDAEIVQSGEMPTVDKETKTIDPNTQKYLSVTPVDKAFKLKLNKLVLDLEAIREDIFNKKNEIIVKRQLIKDTIKILNESKKVRLDKNEIEKTEGQTEKYALLLDSIIYEISHEIAYYKLFASDEKPPVEKIVVPIKAPDKLEDYLDVQMNGIKRYLKNIKRDVAISYSRYVFGFDEHLKHLSYIESYIKVKEAEAKHQATVKTEASE